MNTWLKFGLGILIGSVSVTVAWMWYFGIHPLDPILCSHHVISEVEAPDGYQRAVVFEETCGPPAEVYTFIHLMRGGRESLLNRSGEIFVADTGPKTVAEPWVSVRWETPNECVVRYSHSAQVYLSVTRLPDLGIKYESY